jgi:O-antigen biosynthesis protein
MASLGGIVRHLPPRVQEELRQRFRPPTNLKRLPSRARSYEPLHEMALYFDRVNVAPSHARGVSVVIPHANPAAIFAGIKTALSFAREVAEAHDLPLRIVTTNANETPGQNEPAVQALRRQLGYERITLARVADGEEAVASPADIWVATFWTTALMLDVACRVGALSQQQVVYLVQDYEPSFSPWSTHHAVGRSLYHRGFHLAVNSKPLAGYLAEREQIVVPDSQVFAPDLDYDALAKAAERRETSDTLRLFFYGRPSKPRNLFPLGVAALRRFAEEMPVDRRKVDVFSAGEPHADTHLGRGLRIRALGKLSWERYYELLAGTDLGLSLMLSPHPSHPPLELAVSGALAVTNDLDGARTDIHPSLYTPSADPDLLAEALVDAAGRSTPGSFQPVEAGLLGLPLAEVAATVSARVA